MNISEPDQKLNEYWSNTTTYALQNATSPSGSQDFSNGTSTWVVTNAADTKSWSYGDFWATAIPLLFASVIVPTAGGSAYRRCALFWRSGSAIRKKLTITVLVATVIAGLGYVSCRCAHTRNPFTDVWQFNHALCSSASSAGLADPRGTFVDHCYCLVAWEVQEVDEQ